MESGEYDICKCSVEIPDDEVSDTTVDDSSNVADIIIYNQLKSFNTKMPIPYIRVTTKMPLAVSSR